MGTDSNWDLARQISLPMYRSFNTFHWTEQIGGQGSFTADPRNGADSMSAKKRQTPAALSTKKSSLISLPRTESRKWRLSCQRSRLMLQGTIGIVFRLTGTAPELKCNKEPIVTAPSPRSKPLQSDSIARQRFTAASASQGKQSTATEIMVP